jgi:hypothetical protein
MGRIKRLLQQSGPAPAALEAVCPLCGRNIPPAQRDAHHWVPKSKGGRETAYLHRICHRQIHALFREAELARTLNSAPALLARPEMAAFVAWVQTKPDAFMQATRKSQRLRNRQA